MKKHTKNLLHFFKPVGMIFTRLCLWLLLSKNQNNKTANWLGRHIANGFRLELCHIIYPPKGQEHEGFHLLELSYSQSCDPILNFNLWHENYIFSILYISNFHGQKNVCWFQKCSHISLIFSEKLYNVLSTK